MILSQLFLEDFFTGVLWKNGLLLVLQGPYSVRRQIIICSNDQKILRHNYVTCHLTSSNIYISPLLLARIGPNLVSRKISKCLNDRSIFSLVDLLNKTRLFLINENPPYQTYNNEKKTLLALGPLVCIWQKCLKTSKTFTEKCSVKHLVWLLIETINKQSTL